MIVEQGWLEYGLILILAFVVIVIVTLAMGGQIQEVFYNLMRRLGAQ
jgi:Flp pilus assembly pilin Flp